MKLLMPILRLVTSKVPSRQVREQWIAYWVLPTDPTSVTALSNHPDDRSIRPVTAFRSSCPSRSSWLVQE